MVRALCQMVYMSVHERVRALREALDLTQLQVAERGGLNGQAEVGKVESGANKASSHRARSGLAQGFGLDKADFNAYLDGAVTLTDVLAKVKSGEVEASPNVE